MPSSQATPFPSFPSSAAMTTRVQPAASSAGAAPDPAKISALATVDSPIPTPAEAHVDDPIASLQPTSRPKSKTAAPAAFAVPTALHHSAWSDSSSQTPSGASSLWNGRNSISAATTDSDAVPTAASSVVSTPGRTATTIGSVEISTPPAPGTGPGSGSAAFSRAGAPWSNGPPVKGNSSPLAWPKDLSSPSAEYPLDPSSSPTASKDLRPTADNSLPSAKNARQPSNPPRPNPGRALPKRAPVRSTTLDPSHHLPGDRRLAAGIDSVADHDEASVDDALANTVHSITLGNGNGPEQPTLSPVNTNVPLQPQPQHPSAMGVYQSPDLLGHSQRSSLSYGPFSPPSDGYGPHSPYFPASGRSPDAYTPYPGAGPVLSGMGGMQPIDMSGYESYRTTPDPYAPPLPGRPVFMSHAGPGSQGSAPQSPSFGPSPISQPLAPAPLRQSDAGMFYAGHMGPYGVASQGNGAMPGGMRPLVPHTGAQYAFGGPTASGSRNIPTSPLLGGAAVGMLPSMVVPPAAQMGYPPPQSPMLPGQAAQMGVDGSSERRASINQSGPGMYPGATNTGSSASIHRRMGSNMGDSLSARPQPTPFGAAAPYPGPGGFLPGQPTSPALVNSGFGGPTPGWSGRLHDHRRGPGAGSAPGGAGMMGPPMGGFGGPGMGGLSGYMRPPGPHGMGGGYYGPVGAGGLGGPQAAAAPVRSPLLEEFRSRHAKNKKFELRDIFGSIVEFSGDQHGSRFIQEKLDTAGEEERTRVYDEVLPSARQLMTDVFGNYVIQKMLEHGTYLQRATLAKEMEGHVLALSLGTYGCRVVQKAFDHTDQAQRVRLAEELDGHIMQCVKDQNANHVVQKIIERLDSDAIDFIPTAFRGHVLALAAHCYSCRVLQRIFEHCREEQSRPLLVELHSDALRLMQDQYGNYVIQWVLQKGQTDDRDAIVAKIKGHVLSLSRHKFASNVIEQVIRCASEEDKVALIEEILQPQPQPQPQPQSQTQTQSQGQAQGQGKDGAVPAAAVMMMKDQFANYVLQRFIENAGGEQRARLVTAVRPQLQSLKRSSNGYAKHLAAIERLIEDPPAPAPAPA